MFVVVIAAAPSVGAASAAADTTVVVTTPTDETTPGDGCSLREALAFAGGALEGDCAVGLASGTTTVRVPRGCYLLTLATPLGSGTSVNIEGAGQGAVPCDGSGTVIDAQQRSRVLDVPTGALVQVSGLTLTGGLAGSGGGIFINQSGNLTLTNVTVTRNAAAGGADGGVSGGNGTPGGGGGGGGGITVQQNGVLSVVGSTISTNAAGDGGSGGDVTSGTSGGAGGGGGSGGGINDVEGIVTVTDSTISGNSAGAGGAGGLGGASAAGGGGGDGGDGGGIIESHNSSVTIVNSTIGGNAAGLAGPGALGAPAGVSGVGGAGGGIRAFDSAFLTNATVVANTASGVGDGVDDQGTLSAATTEIASVIAQNGTQNCVGPFTDGGFNLTFPVEPFSGCPGITADPKLGPLQANGGPTDTIALHAGSAAIGLVPSAGCQPADQRGIPRPQGPACDAGAFEWAPPVLSAVSATATGQTTATVNAAITNPDLQDERVAVSYGLTTAYGSVTPPQDIGASNAPTSASIPLSALRPGTLYHLQLLATNADGTTPSTDLTITTAPSPVGTGPPVIAPAQAPTVNGFRQSATSWIEGPALAHVAQRQRSQRTRSPVGTTFSFALNERADYVLSFTQIRAGREVKRRCVAQTRRNRHNPTCPRRVPSGALSFTGHEGLNKVSFQGRLTRTHKLSPGHYLVTIVATNSSNQASRHETLTFTIKAK